MRQVLTFTVALGLAAGAHAQMQMAMPDAHAHDHHAKATSTSSNSSTTAKGKTAATDPDHVPPPPPQHPMPPLTHQEMSDVMHMDGDPLLSMVKFDELEQTGGAGSHGQSWDGEAWIGHDLNKLWLRSEGERSDGKLEDASVEVLYDHAYAPFWDAQVGVRHDLGEGPSRTWAAVGVQGLAPYWFETTATFYAGQNGRTAARVKFEYELLFTQRLVLTPEIQLNAYGKADAARHLGAGLANAEFGLRLRYEITRRFAPYIGASYKRRFAGTAALARADGQSPGQWRWVAGVRWWY
ncbi:copper resistance protein B [Oleiagrimonas sp. C23AA]|uniref:copper resistance protein B n=1 Tax=Oleiagrimonas sp. C23AA TaxID=2719047 RepID=UPI00142106BB|nr:copper resistance protein B [Oleiagrimonas sp. C23AA]NII09097.1 copper resistance protein B [Oleiagrimonas sp. C23AA]